MNKIFIVIFSSLALMTLLSLYMLVVFYEIRIYHYERRGRSRNHEGHELEETI